MLVIKLPKEVVYEDYTKSELSREYVLKEGNLRLYVPNVEEVVEELKKKGFREVKLTLREGEKYSLSLSKGLWELHVRIYENGFIIAHFEVNRRFLEHLTYSSIPSIYEVYEYYKSVYHDLRIYDFIKGKWIIKVLSNYVFELEEPETLTPWFPTFLTCILLYLLR